MMQGKTNILLCDYDDGCDEWTLDDYANTVSTVNGVRITTEQRALGWLSADGYDLCPEHAARHRCSDTCAPHLYQFCSPECESAARQQDGGDRA